ncbi:MAG TPA: aminotransferase class I/II-fold pyridoxal phosphate-dependent enzyme, partial [Actinomycetota bacterium]|nr:aminotransferase class I/II-fold pyridoxal phosphate-dependent enzyme [Actinomycetota bacterium]
RRTSPCPGGPWLAYKLNEPEATRVVAKSLSRQRGREFAPEQILLTNGVFAGLSIVLNALVDPGDEVLYISPPWFFYEVLIAAAGGRPVRVDADRTTFDLDIDAIRDAITDRTRGIIVNSPNNPTGVVYSAARLRELAVVLQEASERNGRPVYLFSDEAYNRIVFDGAGFASPTDHYDSALLLYTYGKTLLTPGERLGYIAVPPGMLHSTETLHALFVAQALTGWAFPVASLQHAMDDLENLSIDVGQLQSKRDRMVKELSAAGYNVNKPQGTFYLLLRSPWPDDLSFCLALAERDVFVLPGRTFEMPGYFRISLTASDDMISRSVPIFAEMATAAMGPSAGR